MIAKQIEKYTWILQKKKKKTKIKNRKKGHNQNCEMKIFQPNILVKKKQIHDKNDEWLYKSF